MTISTRYAINGEGLKLALQVVGGSNPALYFVVPPSIFAEFREQPIKWTGKKRTADGVAGIPQFVMKVEIYIFRERVVGISFDLAHYFPAVDCGS